MLDCELPVTAVHCTDGEGELNIVNEDEDSSDDDWSDDED